MFPILEKLHHSIIVTGNRISNLDLLKKYLIDQEITTEGNPDLFIFDSESLTIDDVREKIIPLVSSKKVSKARFFILSFDRATTESENALLKSIEEPQEGTYFFILVPSSDILLPTILSRSQIIAGAAGAGDTRLSVSEFLKANLAARFALVEDWTKNKKDEDNLSKTEVANFLDQLEKKIWEERFGSPSSRGGQGGVFSKSQNPETQNENTTHSTLATLGPISETNGNRQPPLIEGAKAEQLFADIRQARQYAKIRGASHRIILDFVAMILPTIK